ncbi:phosphopantothenoylcysteine decarboxylase [Anaerocolumna sp. AGMB13020]|uniref:phosphopantothenoylcysteine decarboxylase domain-containing protein n=1 Tax=Anaerocolumna sp. AGMB13020 TaxID=3081750 RepID=UPI0029538CED|nr:phosphopantothenoylcysteine decarboxylase [Anaerocolumna sp. AGMB13020]WOO35283.1 phosphopantothenoylcysteine decarboxylase [Anaerocolumna sp. AGMB13020]
MKILITAGGTTEPIDSVRSITNTSTGKLGSLIAEKFDAMPEVTGIYFICGRKALIPQGTRAEITYVDTVASLESAIKSILKKKDIDIIVHSMAVSDYRINKVTSAAALANSLNAGLKASLSGLPDITEEYMVSLMETSDTILNTDGKIRSDINNLILTMEQTPKIISLFKDLAPNAILTGFKLLDHVSHKELIDTAYGLLEKNKCSFVLANDLKDITEMGHVGYLIDRKKNYGTFLTKEAIAEAIAQTTVKRLAVIREL